MSILTFFCHAVLMGAVMLGVRPASAAFEDMAGLTTNNSLVFFRSNSPLSVPPNPTPITGIATGDTLIGIDLRPTNDLLYVIGKRNNNSARIYTITPPSLNSQGLKATLIATLTPDYSDRTNPYTALSGIDFGMDFDPVANRLRLVSDTGQNLNINVDSGLVTTDEPLSYATRSPRAGQQPKVGAIGYTNSYEGASQTHLYALDLATQSLATQIPPQSGTINPFGQTLGTDPITLNGFDITRNNRAAFAILSTKSAPTASYMYKLDLATGTWSFASGDRATSRLSSNVPLRGFTFLTTLDTPFVTNSETTVNTQTSLLDGLVIRGAQFFKISNITNGTLYLQNGKTVVREGSFITIDQGYAGLKFTPAPNFIGNATFNVRAAYSPSNVDVGGGIATATIFVLPRNEAPRIVSVTPQNASDKVGSKRTFSLTLSDPNGASDIKEVVLLINDRLDWGSGATLVYRPSDTDPTRGTITLRRGDEFLPEVPVGAGPARTLDNGAVRFSSRDVTVVASGNTLTINLSLTLRDGLVGTNTLFASVLDRKDVRATAALPADNGFVRFGNYTVTPQFSTGQNVAPVGRLVPGSVNTPLYVGDIAGDQTFQFAASDADGMGDIESIIFLAGKTRSFANGAAFVYTPRDRRLYLRSDDGQSWLGGVQLGQPGPVDVLENSQVRVYLLNDRVVIGADGKSVVVSIAVNAKRGFIGANKMWLRVQDKSGATAPGGDDQGYVPAGTWNVFAGVPNSSPKSAPSSNGS